MGGVDPAALPSLATGAERVVLRTDDDAHASRSYGVAAASYAADEPPTPHISSNLTTTNVFWQDSSQFNS